MPLIHRPIFVRSHNAPGFTLVELMISIALVLLLMAGVTAVFKASAISAKPSPPASSRASLFNPNELSRSWIATT